MAVRPGGDRVALAQGRAGSGTGRAIADTAGGVNSGQKTAEVWRREKIGHENCRQMSAVSHRRQQVVLVQQWSGLSDEGVENASSASQTLRGLVAIDLS